MAEFVPNAATYTLRLSITHRNTKAYTDSEKKAHMQLTICFPSAEFATTLKESLRRIEDAKQKPVFGQAVKQDDREVSIILPSSVTEIETDAEGIILIFDKTKPKPEDATTWQQYSGIWLLKGKKPEHRLRVQYNWNHTKLVEAVAGSA